MKKKAVFFSADALIATMIIFLAILSIYPFLKSAHHESRSSGDLMGLVSNLKIGEINNSYVQSLISSGKIANPNSSVLEQIGEFYVTNLSEAQLLAKNVFSSLTNNANLGIWYGEDLIYSINKSAYENASNVEVESQFISGIQKGGNSTGFSAKAFLTRGESFSYFYFGGYIGDGNISLNASYDGLVRKVALEIVINKEFDLYINNNFSGHYDKSPSEFTPAKYDLTSYLNRLHNGSNLLEFRGNNLYIAGGYFRIDFNGGVIYSNSKIYSLPGINGIINIYDGISVPENTSNMEIFLHYLSNNQSIFLNIGNKTILNETLSGEQRKTITNDQLSSLLSYSEFSGKTIPFRLGIENMTYTAASTRPVDVVSVADISGSMADNAIYSCNYRYCKSTDSLCKSPYTNRSINWQNATCNVSAISDCSSSPDNPCLGPSFKRGQNYSTVMLKPNKLLLSQQAHYSFVSAILNNSENNIGLTAYSTSYYPAYSINLTRNQTAISNTIDKWIPTDSTCICCGIRQGINDLVTHSQASRIKAIVVMSDGLANVACPGTTLSAINSAINESCYAKQRYNITVNAVAFGSDADNATLRAIANCGGGNYSYANTENLIELYKRIAHEIITASYTEQTINVSGNLTTILFPDSFIRFNYTSKPAQYGMITTSENTLGGNLNDSFSVPSNSKVIEARVVSYSGARWTSNIKLNGFSVYNLTDYGNDYIRLGDPYSFYLPIAYVNLGNNSLKLNTALSPSNLSDSSSSNKVILTLLQNSSSFSPISVYASGCFWNIEFEDGTNSSMIIPNDYSGISTCFYSKNKREYNPNDAIQKAVYSLLLSLDYDSNGKVDYKFSDQDLNVSSSTIMGIPYTWNTEVQIRRWF